MIIEIKNLPEGRKVKHINVDITFEEDGAVVKTVTEEKSPQPNVKFDNVPTPPQTVVEREHKEIPPEMQDLEF